MVFIGIIADSKDYNFIKKEVSKNKELKLININFKNIENVKNIKFETIVICNMEETVKTEIFKNMIKNIKYFILNTDIKIGCFEIDNVRTITFGLNQKATVTASSISEEEIMVCMQRNIENAKGEMIEMQEVCVNSSILTNKRVYSILVIFIINQLYKS